MPSPETLRLKCVIFVYDFECMSYLLFYVDVKLMESYISNEEFHNMCSIVNMNKRTHERNEELHVEFCLVNR